MTDPDGASHAERVREREEECRVLLRRRAGEWTGRTAPAGQVRRDEAYARTGERVVTLLVEPAGEPESGRDEGGRAVSRLTIGRRRTVYLDDATLGACLLYTSDAADE